jgi:hypothetical protein
MAAGKVVSFRHIDCGCYIFRRFRRSSSTHGYSDAVFQTLNTTNYIFFKQRKNIEGKTVSQDFKYNKLYIL